MAKYTWQDYKNWRYFIRI